ncbi:class I SAM-dependent methyltransferase [Streptomyces niveiscabiei]|uniref:class I SAM-dependent DNA methyltransferase n=1 Tax=Streptomyces niveiscabiei TaxID=164115 RepID=UPI0029AB0CE4|nr:class I SAM-dependent methyltransferase [Streptomyces niveiscabiei]MDX3387273.1 class I SAM-dependent methyltransferase [Streptomyces niveiscabiei]
MTDADFIHNARDSYDKIAEDYAEQFPSGLGDRPVDRGLVGAFAELVKARGTEPVADLGSGPGYVTAHLRDLGLQVFGVDLSPRMVALARQAHPGLRFHVGSMTALDLPDQTLGGIFSLFSVIHIPDSELPALCKEFSRVLVPGGYVLLCFQTDRTTTRLRITERFGHDITLDYHWHDPARFTQLLAEEGLLVEAHCILEPPEGANRPRAILLARKG